MTPLAYEVWIYSGYRPFQICHGRECFTTLEAALQRIQQLRQTTNDDHYSFEMTPKR